MSTVHASASYRKERQNVCHERQALQRPSDALPELKSLHGTLQNRGVVSDVELPSLTTQLDVGESDLDYALAFSQVSPLPHDNFHLVDSKGHSRFVLRISIILSHPSRKQLESLPPLCRRPVGPLGFYWCTGLRLTQTAVDQGLETHLRRCRNSTLRNKAR